MTLRSLLLACVAMLAAGCAQNRSVLTPEGAARMAGADSSTRKLVIARENCTKAGLVEGTRRFARCVTAYHALDAARARDEASRHGLCVDPIRFELARCIEI